MNENKNWYKKAKKSDEELKEYSWTYVDAPELIFKHVLAYGKNIPDSQLYTEDGDWSYGRETDPHITLKWGLHADEPKEVKECLKDQKGGSLKLGETDIFENENFDVLIVKVDSDDMKRLNKHLRDNLEHTDTHPNYKPHLTIAYLQPGEGKKYKGDKRFNGLKWNFDTVYFGDKEDNITKIEIREESPLL